MPSYLDTRCHPVQQEKLAEVTQEIEESVTVCSPFSHGAMSSQRATNFTYSTGMMALAATLPVRTGSGSPVIARFR